MTGGLQEPEAHVVCSVGDGHAGRVSEFALVVDGVCGLRQSYTRNSSPNNRKAQYEEGRPGNQAEAKTHGVV